MGMLVAWTRAGVRLSCILLISLGAESTSLAQVSPDTASTRPLGSVPAKPKTSSVAGASDWLPGSPAAADSAAADSIAGDTQRPAAVISTEGDKSAGSASGVSTSLPGQTATIPSKSAGPTAGSAARASAGPSGGPYAADRFLRLPRNTATGISIGYPAYPGLFVIAPADGPLAFRSGLTGFPTIGLLWTPGLEYRFGQEPGTLSQNGVYAFGNAFLGRTYLEGDKEYAGAEAGFGYRWFIDDRRGVR